MFPKVIMAKFLGWGQFLVIAIQQASNGHFPQNKSEWVSLLTSFMLGLAVHHSAQTDGIK